MHEASFYIGIPGNKAKCTLCPHECIIQEGKQGICKVRSFRNEKLISDTYGRLSAIAADPVEKKPLYHFYPGKSILSLGSIGCNMHCRHCQNEDISQCIGITPASLKSYSTEDIMHRAAASGTDLVAFTYNEPVVNYEFMLDTARAMHAAGRACVLVSNGYIMPEPLGALLPYISACNIDLKAFDAAFYRKVAGARLAPVLRSMEMIHQAGKHMEVTFLVIPGMNDDRELFRKMSMYLAEKFGKSQVLHLSRYFPHYKMRLPATSMETMEALVSIAREYLEFVYPGNTGTAMDSNTYCPSCGNLLIGRNHYMVTIPGIRYGRCQQCEQQVHGKFSNQ
ncbi:MAG: AmmeMemoRadiSam system radical SAM enzyme [Bacteroidales bacterium]|nr:AmmeMemoRadiSam system radical SAM enzyme [Bacteroidales bacterium]MDT8430880.1 AmmeMemoRadiSam system radical SAM enzyme [Bacteroidales bacterium]